MVASRNGDSEMVQLLLCNGADPKLTTDGVKLGKSEALSLLGFSSYRLGCVAKSRRVTQCVAFVASLPLCNTCTFNVQPCYALML